MKDKVYKLGIIAGVTLIIAPLLYMLLSLFPIVSYNKNLSSTVMNSGYFILGSTLIISFILNREIVLQQHFWKLPAGILFVLLSFLSFLRFPKKINFLIFAAIIVIFIIYAKHKKIL
jgi:hypothetical protein